MKRCYILTLLISFCVFASGKCNNEVKTFYQKYKHQMVTIEIKNGGKKRVHVLDIKISRYNAMI